MLNLYLKYQAIIGLLLYVGVAALFGFILVQMHDSTVRIVIIVFIMALILNWWLIHNLMEITMHHKEEVVLISELVTEIRFLKTEIDRLTDHDCISKDHV